MYCCPSSPQASTWPSAAAATWQAPLSPAMLCAALYCTAQFGGQEPGSHDEILLFAKTYHNVTFPLMAKVGGGLRWATVAPGKAGGGLRKGLNWPPGPGAMAADAEMPGACPT